MKRLAEKQISRDDRSDEEGQEDNLQTGFQKANEEVLATRKIRGLPKRAAAGNAAVPPTSLASPPASTPRFTGFGGFGSSSLSTTNTTSASTTTFGTPSLFSSTQPSATSTSATDTAKSLSSFLSSSTLPPPTNDVPKSLFGGSQPSSFISKPPAPIPTSDKSTTTSKVPSTDSPDLKYYTSLRGLNESLRGAIQKALDDDVFADLAVFLERYKTVRTNIQNEFDGKSPSTTTSAPPTKPLSMPTPPAGGFGFFGTTPPSSSTGPSNGTASGGFTPSIPVPSGGFTFGSSASKPTETKSGAVSSESTSESSKPSTPAFTFGSPSTTSTKAEESRKDATSSIAPFSGFGKPSTTTSSSSPFSFGNANGTSSSAGSAFKTSSSLKTDLDQPTPSSSTFTFGAPAFGSKPFGGPTSTSSSLFGKPLGSGGGDGSSVGFSFGAPSSSAAPLAFPPAQPKPEGEGESTGSATGTGEAEDGPKKHAAESFTFTPDNKHDQEGAGEEDEETVHAIKLKAYVMKEDKEKGSKNWVELGYGVFRIKKHKETGARRVLMRSSSTGQILVNFAFHSAFKPILKNKNITFIGHDTSHSSKTYTLKLQTAEQASELHQALEKEISAKNESQ